MNWMTILYWVAAGLLVWLVFRMVRNHPEMFSKQNLSKSVYTIGLLTLMIIVVVAFCILLLKQ